MFKYATGGSIAQTPKNRKPTVNKKGKGSKKDQNVNDEAPPINNATTAMYQGWSAKKISCFSKLYQMIEEERNTTFGSNFDMKFLEYCTANREQFKKKKKKRL